MAQMSETTEDFSARMVEVIDHAAAALLISIGHQTGLFETLAVLPWATSAEVAEAAGLDERYVREWLAGMVTAGVIEFRATGASDAAAQTAESVGNTGEPGAYALPAHRAAVLTGAAGGRNLAALSQYIPMLADVEQPVIECFRRGGGVPYSQYPRFHTVAAERSRQVFDTVLVAEVLPLVDGLPERLAQGIDVADIGCGSGHAVNLMAQAFAASRFSGLDFSEEATAAATAEAARLGNTNAEFVRTDLTGLDVVDRYDLITAFDAIHDQAQPTRVLANVFRALRPGGVFLMADIKASSNLADNVGVPMSTYMYTVSTMHCMTVSLALDGEGLGTAWGWQRAQAMLAEAGFTDVDIVELDADPRNYYYLGRK
ncbi:methyltransferase domain-containing protein [Mycobacterium koreense]|uniref:Methyltransferase n=1 Tax=Mycolicibacillus koreensis TaxID=1069220 RepID=A0AA91PH56_9MYCO|nr:class I SAM-dependent methyltransferase [Mycolicibacillus koreensis]MCV7249298.1 methyltransferase domain-containing protein [Mycolicibacillus koreensis]ODR10198.1 methyltransferase [Mycolicibacillus koreensis]OSC35554.1 methyltransferase [Mycolicibacillus koreensis]